MAKLPLIVKDIHINDDSRCFVIAEIGHNHQGNIETAKRMIKAAADAGASAVKLQKRDNKSLFTKFFYDRPYNSENSFGDTYGEHREFLEFDLDQYKELQTFSTNLGVVFFATAFDFKSADFLMDIDVPAFKVASGDLRNIPLIKHLAQFGKPLFISTGGGSQEDIDRVVSELKPMNVPYCILQCTAGYPPSWDELNLRVISTLREKYPEQVIGFSSHDNGIAMSVAAYALGARVIEKHFTLDRNLPGPDHKASLEPEELKAMVAAIRNIEIALGDGIKRLTPSEARNKPVARKSLVASKIIKAGEIFSDQNITTKRPGTGISPMRWDEINGRTALRDFAADELIEL